MKNNKIWVTPTEVATVAMCPYQLYLKNAGAKPSSLSNRLIKRGNASHRTFEKHHHKPKYIARLLYILAAAAIALYLLRSIGVI